MNEKKRQAAAATNVAAMKARAPAWRSDGWLWGMKDK
jgi:hypothetical protein